MKIKVECISNYDIKSHYFYVTIGELQRVVAFTDEELEDTPELIRDQVVACCTSEIEKAKHIYEQEIRHRALEKLYTVRTHYGFGIPKPGLCISSIS